LKEEKDVLLHREPKKRFDAIKLPFLLNPSSKDLIDLRRSYFNQLAVILFNHNFEHFITPGYELDPMILAHHMCNSLDHSYTDP
jgi:hypothetical protein